MTPVGEEGLNASIAHDGARFVIAYETPILAFDNDVLVQRFDATGMCICLAGDECPALLTRSTSEALTPAAQPEHRGLGDPEGD